jgi:SapC
VINQKLHTNPVALDSVLHRDVTLGSLQDWNVANKMNSIFVAVAEFADISREYPLVFVSAGTDEAGAALVAPVAIFGLSNEENLYLRQGQWRADYLPAVLRMYPFGTGRIDAERYALCIDLNCPFIMKGEGQRLFDADGKATTFLDDVNKQMQQIENDVERTRQFCGLLMAQNLLREMRFDAELPNGQKLVVDGFLTIDEEKLAQLPDAVVLEWHRNGVLSLVQAHRLSLGNMRRLVAWRLENAAAAAPAA